MTGASTDASLRRLGLREKWACLRHSDALKNLLEEFAFWTALWTGFPLCDELDPSRQERSQP
jgi:hypothetical protein